MNILITNVHSTRNAGDAALLDMAVQTARSAHPEAQITLLMDDPELGPLQGSLGDVRVVKSFAARLRSPTGHWRAGAIVVGFAFSLGFALAFRWSKHALKLPGAWRELCLAYSDADIVLSCPGNIFAHTARLGLPFLVSAWTVAVELLMGKPLYVLPQSIGPLRHRWERTVVRALYSRARTVMVREPVSLRLASSIGLDPARVRLVPDLAFACIGKPDAAGQRLVDWLSGCPRPIVGVTVINRLLSEVSDIAWNRYERALAGSLSVFVQVHGGCVVFFPQVVGPADNEDDRIASRRVAALMDLPDHVHVLDEWLSADSLRAAYGVADIFVATRMHSAVFATSSCVPTLLLEYLSKSRGLAELLDLEAWLLPVSEANEGALKSALAALWDARSAVRAHLEAVVPELASQARAAGRYLVSE